MFSLCLFRYWKHVVSNIWSRWDSSQREWSLTAVIEVFLAFSVSEQRWNWIPGVTHASWAQVSKQQYAKDTQSCDLLHSPFIPWAQRDTCVFGRFILTKSFQISEKSTHLLSRLLYSVHNEYHMRTPGCVSQAWRRQSLPVNCFACSELLTLDVLSWLWRKISEICDVLKGWQIWVRIEPLWFSTVGLMTELLIQTCYVSYIDNAVFVF